MGGCRAGLTEAELVEGRPGWDALRTFTLTPGKEHRHRDYSGGVGDWLPSLQGCRKPELLTLPLLSGKKLSILLERQNTKVWSPALASCSLRDLNPSP